LAADPHRRLQRLFANVPGRAQSPTLRSNQAESVVSAFKAYLAEDKLPDEVIEGYAITLRHGGFFLVKTEPHCLDQVVTIMRDCAAVRADRHG
jgi:hypothetical protein